MTWMTDDTTTCSDAAAGTPSTVLAISDGVHVLAPKHEVMFKDGSTVVLHPVQVAGSRAMFLRALQLDGQWLVTDLRTHSKELEADVLRLQPRDTQGVVFFTLRGAYRSRAEFVIRVAQLADSGNKRTPLPVPPPRQLAPTLAKDLFS